MPSTTSTTKMHPSDRRPGRFPVVAGNASARPRATRLVAVFAHPAGGRRIAVVAASRAPFLRCLTILPGGSGSPPPGGGPAAPAVALRRIA